MNLSHSHRRRRLVVGAAATTTLAALGRAAHAQSRQLFVNSWGGAWTAAEKAAYYDPFEAETGIKVTPVNGVNYNKLKAQVAARSYEFDITECDLDKAIRAVKENLLEVPPPAVISEATLFPGALQSNAVHNCVLGMCPTWRPDRWKGEKPRTWADYWNVKKFPGVRAGYRHATRMLAIALVADGVPMDKLYPLDIDRGFRKLDEIKPHIRVWWAENSQAQQLLRDGEVDLIPMFAARAADLASQGVQVELSWEGALCVTNMYAVARGAPNIANAWQFIRFVSQPQRQAAFCNRLFYSPSNVKAFEFIKPEAAKWMPTHPDNAKQVFYTDSMWESQHFDAINERFNRWLAS